METAKRAQNSGIFLDFRYLGLNYGRHRPPDSRRIGNVQAFASVTLSRCKETIQVQHDGLCAAGNASLRICESNEGLEWKSALTCYLHLALHSENELNQELAMQAIC